MVGRMVPQRWLFRFIKPLCVCVCVCVSLYREERLSVGEVGGLTGLSMEVWGALLGGKRERRVQC